MRWRLPSRRLLVRLVPAVLVAAGIGVFVYPVVATQYNNLRQHEFADAYAAHVEDAPSTMLADELAAARRYNARISGIPILDPWLTEVSRDPTSADYQAYLTELDGLPAMARLRVPSVGIDLPVDHGTSDEVIANGVGHLYGTSLPVGGEGTHAVLTSHTGLSNATLFDHLDEVQIGDVMTLDVYGETLAYQVDRTKVVLPDEISDLRPVAGDDLLTLVTCTPYGVNSHRLLVRGHRVPIAPGSAAAAAADAPGPGLEPWMWWLLGGAAVGVTALGVILTGTVRRSRSGHAGAEAPAPDPDAAPAADPAAAPAPAPVP